MTVPGRGRHTARLHCRDDAAINAARRVRGSESGVVLAAGAVALSVCPLHDAWRV